VLFLYDRVDFFFSTRYGVIERTRSPRPKETSMYIVLFLIHCVGIVCTADKTVPSDGISSSVT